MNITKRMTSSLACVLFVLILVSPGYAYIGPGAGAGVVSVVLGLLGSLFLLLLGIIWYPVKRMLKIWRKRGQGLEMDIVDDDKLDTGHNNLCHCDGVGPEVSVKTNIDQP
jgi:hypothetical protein